jgi:hypothetical protein
MHYTLQFSAAEAVAASYLVDKRWFGGCAVAAGTTNHLASSLA